MLPYLKKKEAENVREKSKNETSGGNAPEPDSAPNSDTGSAGVFQVVNFVLFFLYLWFK
jgi:hypothetical protein